MAKKNLVIVLFVLVVSLLSCHYLPGFLVRQPQPDFELSVDTESLVLVGRKGSVNSTIVTVRSINGFEGSVAIRVKLGLVIGVVEVLCPSEIDLAANEQAVFELSFHVLSVLAPGRCWAEVVASTGQLEHSVRITINVNS